MIALSLSLALCAALAFRAYTLWLASERNALNRAERAEHIAEGLVAKWNEHEAKIADLHAETNTLKVKLGFKLGPSQRAQPQG